jgi:hypothetical protein
MFSFDFGRFGGPPRGPGAVFSSLRGGGDGGGFVLDFNGFS